MEYKEDAFIFMLFNFFFCSVIYRKIRNHFKGVYIRKKDS